MSILTPADGQRIVLTCNRLAKIPPPPPVIYNGIQYLKDLGDRDQALQGVLDVLEDQGIILGCRQVGWEEGKMWLHLTGKGFAKRRLFALRMILTSELKNLNVKVLEGLHGRLVNAVVESDDIEEFLGLPNPPFLIFPPAAGSTRYRLQYIVADGPAPGDGQAPGIVAAADAPSTVAAEAGDASTIVAAGDAPVIVAAGDAPVIVAAGSAPDIDVGAAAAGNVIKAELHRFNVIEVTVGDSYTQAPLRIQKQQTRRRCLSTEPQDRGHSSTTADMRTNLAATSLKTAGPAEAKKGAEAGLTEAEKEAEAKKAAKKEKKKAKKAAKKGAKAKDPKEKTDDEGAKAKASEVEGVKGVQANPETVSQSSKKRERELSHDASKVVSPAVKRRVWNGL